MCLFYENITVYFLILRFKKKSAELNDLKFGVWGYIHII